MRSSFNLIEVKKSRTRTTPAEEEDISTKKDIAYTQIELKKKLNEINIVF